MGESAVIASARDMTSGPGDAGGAGAGAAEEAGAAVEGPRYRVGERVQVDFDDEGWFAGVVYSCAQLPSPEAQGSRRFVYSVRLDDGQLLTD